MEAAYRNLLIFVIAKLGLMYLMKVWIRQNLKTMEKNGVVLPVIPK